MSLRDQLVAKGLVSKKEKRRVDRSKKRERKKKQGTRARKSVERREVALASEAERAIRLRERALTRKLREAEREAIERTYRIRQIITGNTLRTRGKRVYWHRALEGPGIPSLRVSERAAYKLRCGEAAIAGLRLGEDAEVEYRVISARAAARLEELGAGDVIVSWVRDVTGIGEPSEAFLEPDWEISLIPHRLRD